MRLLPLMVAFGLTVGCRASPVDALPASSLSLYEGVPAYSVSSSVLAAPGLRIKKAVPGLPFACHMGSPNTGGEKNAFSSCTCNDGSTYPTASKTASTDVACPYTAPPLITSAGAQVIIGGQTVTANPSGFVVSGATILPGGSPVTVANVPVSLGSSGALVISGSIMSLSKPVSTSNVGSNNPGSSAQVSGTSSGLGHSASSPGSSTRGSSALGPSTHTSSVPGTSMPESVPGSMPGPNPPTSSVPGSNVRGSSAHTSGISASSVSSLIVPGTPIRGSSGPTSAAPGSSAPGSSAPGSSAPGSSAPGSSAPGSSAPGSSAPGSRASESGSPTSSNPGSIVRGSSALVTSVPTLSVSGALVPVLSASASGTHGSSTSRTSISKLSASGSGAFGSDASGSNGVPTSISGINPHTSSLGASSISGLSVVKSNAGASSGLTGSTTFKARPTSLSIGGIQLSGTSIGVTTPGVTTTVILSGSQVQTTSTSGVTKNTKITTSEGGHQTILPFIWCLTCGPNRKGEGFIIHPPRGIKPGGIEFDIPGVKFPFTLSEASDPEPADPAHPTAEPESSQPSQSHGSSVSNSKTSELVSRPSTSSKASSSSRSSCSTSGTVTRCPCTASCSNINGPVTPYWYETLLGFDTAAIDSLAKKILAADSAASASDLTATATTFATSVASPGSSPSSSKGATSSSGSAKGSSSSAPASTKSSSGSHSAISPYPSPSCSPEASLGWSVDSFKYALPDFCGKKATVSASDKCPVSARYHDTGSNVFFDFTLAYAAGPNCPESISPNMNGGKDCTAIYNSHKRDEDEVSNLSAANLQDSTPKKMWNPCWLHRSVLISFGVLFASMFVAVILLYHFSKIYHGFGTRISTNKYSWKYGPTAVLVVIISLWRQVDYQSRTLVPWQELRNGPSPGNRSILLDYISPMIHEILLASVKKRHWAVLASSVGFLLLQLTTVFSTGLLVLEPREMTQSHFPFTVRRDFGATDYNSSIVGAAPAQRLYGMQTKQLQYPVGTSENLVLQNLDPQSESPTMAGSTYAAEVQGFSTGLDCEILQLGNATKKFLPWFSIQAPYFVVNITTDSCHIENAIVGQGADHGYYKNDSATESYQGLFQNFTCNTGADNSLKFHPSGDSTMDHRFLLSMALLQWTPHIPVSEASHIWVKQLTGVLCKPTYSIDNYSVSYKQAQDAPTMQATKIPGTNSTLEGFDNSQLTQAVQTSLEKASFGQGGAEYVVVAVPSIFQLMEVMNNASTLRPFLDPNLLLTLGSRVFQGVSSQVASQYLMKPLNSTTYGSLTHTEDRLQVKPLTVGLMATCLGLLVCIAMLEVFIRPWSTVCVEPKTISSLARILAASGSLREYLTCMGSATLNTLQCRLSQDKFQTVIAQDKQRSFVLEHLPQSTEPNEIPLSAPPDSKLEWWRPMAVKGWFGALAIIIPLCLIILLEVLQRESDKKGGLLGVATSGVDSHILSTYLPALVMLGVATMYSSLDFAISIFVPLAALRRGNGTAAQSIMVSTVGSHPLHAFLLSLRTRSGTRCITIFAGFVASFLTVVVSALYNVGTVTKSHEVSLQQGDFFNWNHVDLSLDDKFAGVITDLIVYSNTSYPQWTYDNLVFPSLTPSSANNATSSNDSASVVVTVPAIRGSLSCSAVPPTSIKVSARGALPSCTTCNDLVELDYQVFLPSNLCGLDAKNLNMTGQTLSWSHSYAVPNDSSQVYAGLGTDLQWAQEYITGEGVVAPGSTYSTDNYMSGCPSFAFSLGTANAGTRTNKTMGDGLAWTSQQDINFMICHQQLEQVMTNVSLSYPDLRVIRTSPPVPLESTATVIIKGNTDNWFHISLNTFINALQDLGTSVTGRNGINGFIQALVWGKNGIPIEQLYNNGDVSTTLTTAANRIYGQYIAQAISANMRTTVPPISQDPSLPNNQTHPTYTATLSQPYQRLQQNRGPKIALQVMLSFMAVCAIATHILMETARVVPHNPCSIAGMMSLLADSELCGTRTLFPKGSEWKSDAELRRESIYEGLLFRIGWWEKVDEGMGNGQGRRRVYGIDVVRTLGDDHS